MTDSKIRYIVYAYNSKRNKFFPVSDWCDLEVEALRVKESLDYIRSHRIDLSHHVIDTIAFAKGLYHHHAQA